MGGRGGASGLSAANIPKINNPAGIPQNAITEDEFLSFLDARKWRPYYGN